MRCRQSARLTPEAAIRINTSPAFGSGTGRVPGTSISGPPGALISITVWVAGILANTSGPLDARMLGVGIAADASVQAHSKDSLGAGGSRAHTNPVIPAKAGTHGRDGSWPSPGRRGRAHRIESSVCASEH